MNCSIRTIFTHGYTKRVGSCRTTFGKYRAIGVYLSMDLSVCEMDLDAALALVLRFVTAVMDVPLKAESDVTSPGAIAKNAVVIRVLPGYKAIVATDPDLAPNQVVIGAVERHLQGMSELCRHAHACV